MNKETPISVLVSKLEGMWPILKNNEEHKEAITLILSEKAKHVSPDDFLAGYRLLVQLHRTGRDDGSPAWPPSPTDVLGCVLSAHRDRKSNGVKITTPYRGPRRVAGKVCRKCQQAIVFHPGDRMLFCPSCRTVQAVGDGVALTPHEVHSLEFLDSESDYDTEEAEKAKALAAIKRLGTK